MIFDTISNISRNSKNSQINSHNETSLDKMFIEKINNLENDNFLFIYYSYKLKEKSLNQFFSFESLTEEDGCEKENDLIHNYDSIKDMYQNNLVESIISTSNSDENNLNENISNNITSKKSKSKNKSQRSVTLSPDKNKIKKEIKKEINKKSKSVTKKNKKSFFLNIIQEEDNLNNENKIKKTNINYKKKFKTKLSKNEVCSICRNNFCNKEIVCEIKLCNHIFHQKCLDKWIKYKKNSGEIRCPLCKTFI